MHEELMIWFAQAVAHSLWQGALIGAVAWLALGLVRRNPGRQHVVLGVALVLLGACLPFNLALRAPDLADQETVEVAGPTTSEVKATVAEGPKEEGVLTVGMVESLLNWEGREGETRTAIEPSMLVEEPRGSAWHVAAPWVVALYAAGVLLMSLRLLLASGGSWRIKRRSRAVSESEWQGYYRAVLRRLNLKVQPALHWSEEVAAPVLVGVFKPMVILPVALASRLSPQQAEAVLAHELAHLKRFDHWALLLQRIVETICFYHPVIWVLSRQMHRAREQACDDLVLASGSQPDDYAESLVLCSELRRVRSGLSQEGAVQLAATGPHGSSLRQRVLRVLGEERVRSGRLGWLLSSACALTLLLGAAWLITPVEANNPPAESELAPDDDAVLKASPEPESQPLAMPKGETVKHVDVRGDTLYSIAKAYGSSVAKLKELNPKLQNGFVLRIGEVLVVPWRQPQSLVIASLVIAEVPVAYEVKDATVRQDVLQKSKDARIISRPSLATASGEQGKIEIGGLDKPAGQGSWLAIDLTPKVGTTTDRLGRRFDLSFDLRIEQKDRAADGVVRSQEMKTTMHALFGKAVAIDGVPLRGGKKLVGSVTFTRAKLGDPVPEAGHVFDILVNGAVFWRGREFRDKGELFKLLPKGGKRAVVRARPDTPFASVVALSDLLELRYKNVSFSIIRDEKKVEPRAADDPQEEEARRIANCHSEMRALQFELDELLKTREPHHPEVRRVMHRITTIKEYLADVEASRDVRANRDAMAEEISQLSAILVELQRVYRDKHPKVVEVKTKLEALRANLGRGNDIIWAEAEIRELEGDIATKLANGLGNRHPSVGALRKKVAMLKEFQKSRQLKGIKIPKKEPQGERPPVSPEGVLPEALPRLERPQSLPLPEEPLEKQKKADLDAIEQFYLRIGLKPPEPKIEWNPDAGSVKDFVARHKKSSAILFFDGNAVPVVREFPIGGGESENLLDPLGEHSEMKLLQDAERELERLETTVESPDPKRIYELKTLIRKIKSGSKSTP